MHEKLDKIDRLVKLWDGCQRCKLCWARDKIVHWRGNPYSKLLLIGEAPGADEDVAGRPFVGRAGRLLDEMLTEVGLDPGEDVAITNVVACRPPSNRVPSRDEIKACRPRLNVFIRIVQPNMIVLLGATAAKLAGVFSMAGHRGSECEVEIGNLVIQAVPTYHPSFILRTHNSEYRRQVIKDLKLAADKSRCG